MADYTEQLQPLKQWVTEITNAIREKDGSTGAIKHIDIPDRILSIPTITEENIQQIEKNTKEIEDARVGYFGKSYDTLEERIDGDINNVLNKVDVVNYKDTTIHATNTYARNLTANRNKVEILGQTIQNCLNHSSADKFETLPSYITVDSNGYINITAFNNYLQFITKLESMVLKPSTLYTFVIDVIENSLVMSDTEPNFVFGDTSPVDTPSKFSSKYFIKINSAGMYKFKLTTKDSFEDCICSSRDSTLTNIISGSIKFRYMVVEGDWTNKDISFVPFGLNTPQSTEIVMYGKNLFKLKNNNTTINGINIVTDDDLFSASGTATKTVSLQLNDTSSCLANELAQGGKFVMSLKNATYNADTCNISLIYRETIGGAIKYIIANGIAASVSKGSILNNIVLYISSGTTVDLKNVGVQLERANSLTEYEPYIYNTVKIEYPLGSVSETIRDKVYLKDGKAYYEHNCEEKDGIITSLDKPVTNEIEIDDFYSYEGQTNWQTTNVIKPTLNVDIPSNLNAVVSTLMTENSTLKNENKVLSAELELTNNAVEQQQADIDYISMMTEVQL